MADPATPSKPFYKKWWFIVLALIVIVAIFMPKGKDSAPVGSAQNPTVPEAAPAPSSNDAAMTLSEFNKIHSGMSYQQVTKIVGSAGEVMSENELAGHKTTMYKFDGEGKFGANANVMIQDGKVVTKAQFGLE